MQNVCHLASVAKKLSVVKNVRISESVLLRSYPSPLSANHGTAPKTHGNCAGCLADFLTVTVTALV